ncbi:ABC-2 type transport system ATP-binding protein [Staphylococcus caledonicus]|uniref:ATP-binding cassette domain-containing protein n=1 Tax=Staphylococcus caledonicus TaxID=2741333 RepID=UPI003C30C292
MDNFVIEAKGISKVIGTNKIIEHLDLFFPQNAIILAEGKNGSGKSVTLKMLAKLLQPTKGLIHRSGSISYAPDILPSTINLTVREYLNFIGKLSSTSENKLTMGYLIELFDLDTFLDKKIRACSKGTQQKVNIIQCLVKKADIYIMDEPFSGLDKQAIITLKSLLISKKETATVILTSHEETLDSSFITHQFNLEENKLFEITQKSRVQNKIIKVGNQSHMDLITVLENSGLKIIKKENSFLIKVSSSQSNETIANLIKHDYFIEEVREDNEDDVY